MTMQIYASDAPGPLEVSGFIDPDDVTIIEVYWGAPVWVASTVYKLGDIVRPTVDNGFYYGCITTGKSGATEPDWGRKVTSGTAKFSAQEYDLFIKPGEAIVSSLWTPAELITLADESLDAVRTEVTVSAVPSTLTTFDLTNQVTAASGEKLSRTLRFSVRQQ